MKNRSLELSLPKQKKIDKGILSLIKTLDCPEIAELPVYLDYAESAPPAYTTAKGIWIRQDVANKAPEQVHKYLLHEILHHVVRRPETGKFDGRTVNIAEDYIINYVIDTTFGLGKATDFYAAGIYDKNLGILGLKNQTQLCMKVLEKTGGKTSVRGCGCTGLAHPVIKYVADKLKRALNYNLKVNKELIVLDDDDRETYKYVRPKLEKELSNSYNLPVDLESVVQGMYFKRTKPMSKASLSDSRYFTPEELFVAGWHTDVYQNESEDSTVYAIHRFLDVCSKEQQITVREWQRLNEKLTHKKQELVRYIKQPVYIKSNVAFRLRRKLRKKPTALQIQKQYNLEVKKLKTFIDRAPRRLKILNDWANTSLYDALATTKITSKASSTRLSLKGLSATTNMSLFPNINSTDIGKRLRFLSTRAAYEPSQLDDLIKDMKDALKGLPSAAGVDSEKDEPSPSQPENPDAQPEGAENKDGDEGEGEDDIKEGEINGGEDTEENQKRVNNPLQEKSGQLVAGKQSGNLVHRLSNIRAHKIVLLENIISFKNEFDTLITKGRSKKSDENRAALDTVPTFGSDIARVDQMELALLNNPTTRLMQLAKLANSELSMRVPSERKRQPIVFMLDGSGSMGNEYATAAGFCLSMAEKLNREKRGWAFFGFDCLPYSLTSSEPDAMKFAEDNRIEFMDGPRGLINFISTPSFGGTNFYSAINKSTEFRRDMKWGACQYILITDGGDNLTSNDVADLRSKMHPEDKFMTLLVNKHTAGVQEISDKILLATRKNMKHELIELGTSLL